MNIQLTYETQSFFPLVLTSQPVTREGNRSRNGEEAYVAELEARPIEGSTVLFREQHSDRTLRGTVTAVRGIVTGMVDLDVEIAE